MGRRRGVEASWENGGRLVKAVRFDEYGDIDVLKVVDVPTPVPGPGQVLVQVKAAGINPGEAKIREGLMHARWPATFPSGQGSDLAGVVAATGSGVTGFATGDEGIGFTDNRAAQAEYVVVEEQNLTAKPAGVPWEVAGALNVVGASASTLAELAGLIADGQLEVPIAATYPLGQVQEAYRRLASGHIRGKIVLIV